MSGSEYIHPWHTFPTVRSRQVGILFGANETGFFVLDPGCILVAFLFQLHYDAKLPVKSTRVCSEDRDYIRWNHCSHGGVAVCPDVATGLLLQPHIKCHVSLMNMR